MSRDSSTNKIAKKIYCVASNNNLTNRSNVKNQSHSKQRIVQFVYIDALDLVVILLDSISSNLILVIK